MTAVFIRELKSYFLTPSGYVFSALLLLTGGLIFAANNLLGGSADIRPVTDGLSYLLFFTVPLLTARHFTGKPGMERILLSSPVSVSAVVMGKFLAALAVLFIGEAVCFLYPILLALSGAHMLEPALTGYFGLLLYGGVLISAGLFISSLASGRSAAAASTVVVLLLALFAESVVPYIGSPWLKSTLIYASPSYNLEAFEAGVPGITSLVYFAGIALFFLFLTSRVMQRKRCR